MDYLTEVIKKAEDAALCICPNDLWKRRCIILAILEARRDEYFPEIQDFKAMQLENEITRRRCERICA